MGIEAAGKSLYRCLTSASNTQAFNGENSYSGTTTVGEGTLLINGTHRQS